MTFLVYETKFTVGKSKEMVFTAGKKRGHVTGRKLDTYRGGNSPRDV